MAESALDWLYATQFFGVKLGLENMDRLLREFEAHPARGVKVLHVAGTNGKGSTCAIADSVARAAGWRTGLFTSPHLVDFRERIRVDGEMIPEDVVTRELDALRERVVTWPHHPTFFEISLVLAMRYFRARGCELIILETGMGGRLDATTAVPADVAAITPIGLDHCEWLGDTLERIAAEKAGIIVPGKPVISAPQAEAAARVLRETANVRRAPLRFIEAPLAGYRVALPGAHQQINAALAIESLHAIGVPLRVETVRHGLERVRWPGRFDVRENGGLVLDGSHNEEGALALARAWQERYPGKPACLVFGAVMEKDLKPMLRALAPVAARWVLTSFHSPRAVDPDALAIACRECGVAGDFLETANSPSDALGLARRHGLPVLVAGSLYLVGEVIANLENLATRSTCQ